MKNKSAIQSPALSLGEIRDGATFQAIQYGTIYRSNGATSGITGIIDGLSADDARAQIKAAINRGGYVSIHQST